MNPWMVCILLLSLLLLWPVLCQRVGERRRVLFNTALACAAAFIILYATILNRTPGNYELILTPFAALTTSGVRVSMAPKISPVRTASENLGLCRVAPLPMEAAKASMDMPKARRMVADKFMCVS